MFIWSQWQLACLLVVQIADKGRDHITLLAKLTLTLTWVYLLMTLGRCPANKIFYIFEQPYHCVICPKKGGRVEYVNTCMHKLFRMFWHRVDSTKGWVEPSQPRKITL